MTETAADAVSGMIAEGIAKASVLSEAVPHIARYAGTTVVVNMVGMRWAMPTRLPPSRAMWCC